MKILAIETSCDDTGIAILEVDKKQNFKVLANLVSSQIEVHKKYGGVYPAMAKREHQKNLVPTFVEALKGAKILTENTGEKKIVSFLPRYQKLTMNNILEREQDLQKKLIPFLKKYSKPDIDLISVTSGPGLEPCLWVGVNFAKALSYFWNIPVVPVNHIESHILVNFVSEPSCIQNVRPHTLYTDSKSNKKIFPAICLVASGGHTQIILMKKIGKYKILGETRDDAAGECFDKCAKILGLGYPGGPIISKLAEVDPRGLLASRPRGSTRLPRPMMNTKDYDFSFSGLKTAVLYAWQKIEKGGVFRSSEKHSQNQIAMSAEVQQAIIDVLIKKTMKAVKDFNVKSLILGGGVSANKELRKQFKIALEKIVVANLSNGKNATTINLLVPEPKLSTDNALMTAITGYYHRNKKLVKSDLTKLATDGNLRISK